MIPNTLPFIALVLLAEVVGQAANIDTGFFELLEKQGPFVGLLAIVLWMQWRRDERMQAAWERSQDRFYNALAEHKKSTDDLARAVASLAVQVDPGMAKIQAEKLLHDLGNSQAGSR